MHRSCFDPEDCADLGKFELDFDGLKVFGKEVKIQDCQRRPLSC